jgi:hypothetical protein
MPGTLGAALAGIIAAKAAPTDTLNHTFNRTRCGVSDKLLLNQFFLSTQGCLILSFRYILINSSQFALEFISHLAGIQLAFYYARCDQDNQFVFGFIIGCTSKHGPYQRKLI